MQKWEIFLGKWRRLKCNITLLTQFEQNKLAVFEDEMWFPWMKSTFGTPPRNVKWKKSTLALLKLMHVMSSKQIKEARMALVEADIKLG